MASAADYGPNGRPALAAGLAAAAHGLGRSAIHASAADHAAALILDAIGCALAGWAAEETPQLLHAARLLGDSGTATVIGDARPASLIGATLANAYLTTAVTACDVYTPAHCHLTPEIVPAALAIAEAKHASGSELLTAVTAGLEVTSRLLRAIDYGEFRSRGWHAPGVIGPVGAAVAAGRLLGLRRHELQMAMSLAVSQAAGTFAAWPTTAVKFHQARGAAAGLLAALLAAEGFTASPEPFEAPDGGLFASYSPGAADVALAGFGDHWELEQISVRLWPGATPVQALITALLAPGVRLPPASDLARLEIGVSPAVHVAHRDLAHPAGCFEALLSFHYVAAAIVTHGRFGIDLTDPQYLKDPALGNFIDEHIVLVPDPAVPRGGARVALTTRDGQVTDIHQEHALGTPQLPASRGQLADKFRDNARTRLSLQPAEELAAGLNDLDSVGDCADLLGLTRSGSPS